MTDHTEITAQLNYHASEIQRLTAMLSGDNAPSPAPEFQEISGADKFRRKCRDNGWPVIDNKYVSEAVAEKLLGYPSHGALKMARSRGGAPEHDRQASPIQYDLSVLYEWGHKRGKC